MAKAQRESSENESRQGDGGEARGGCALREAYHGPEIGPSDIEPAVVVVRKLRGPEDWTRARGELKAWGRSFADIHRLDNDHVVIMFWPGAARGLAR